MPQFIVDCSVAMSWCFEDEQTPATQSLLARLEFEEALVPALWLYEVSNVLAIAERRGRCSHQDTTGYLQALRDLPITLDPAISRDLPPALVEVSRTTKLSAYDSAYLELALRSNLPIATLDRELRDAAKKLGVKVLG